MQFSIELYETSSGRAVVEEELENIEQQMPLLYDLLIAGLHKLRIRDNHRPPLCKPLGDGLFELRVGRRDIARAVWFFQHGQRLVVVHCFVKKTSKTPPIALELAAKRRADYLARHTSR